ncbi:MAG: hypothetical protein PHQ04_00235 [Opitutaceae bacterium]|nr:hypothetical protein [Opitutaceae bacterium]
MSTVSGAEEPKLLPMRTTAGLLNPEEPYSLVIGYQAQPETRIAFRKYLTKEFIGQLDRWQQGGVLQNYQLLFQNIAAYNRYPDAILIITFPNFRATYNWNKIEEERPGGLSEDGLKLAAPKYSMITERVAQRFVQAADPSDNVIEVGYYNINDSNLYPQFIKEYVVPLWDNWIGQGNGAITEYAVYKAMDAFLFGREHTQYVEPWQALVVLGYRDADAYTNRARMVLKSYADLQTNVRFNYWTAKEHRAQARQQFTIAFYRQIGSSWK